MIYGRQIKVHTDHEPLQFVAKQQLAQIIPRLQRMMLLLKYNLEITYKVGKDIITADLLCRAGAKTKKESESTDEEIVVHPIETHCISMSPERSHELKPKTTNDMTL